MSEREELIRLRRIRELEAKAAGRPAGPSSNDGFPDNKMVLQSEKDALAYGGENPSALKQFGLGLKHSALRQYSGVKDLIAGLSPEDKRRLQQGEAFVNQHGGAASAGQFVGDLAPDVALGVATRGASLPWRMGAQGASSFIRTPGDMEDRALAGGVSAVGEGVGTALGAALRGTKNFMEPFYQVGRERIVNRTLNGAYTGEGDLLSAILRGNKEIIQGVKPTTAQAAQDAGISRLSDSLSASNPVVGNALKNSDIHRNTAYQTLMRNIAGTPEELARAEEIRKLAAKSDFGAANASPLISTPELDAVAQRLSMNPFVKESVPDALKLAEAKFYNDPANAGKVFVKPADGSVGGLSYIGKTLSDKTGEAFSSGRTGLAETLGDTRDSIVNYLRSASPLYAEAVDNYTKNSRPINQMKVGEHMYKSAFPAVVDESGIAFRMNKNSFLNAKRDADKVVQSVTKMRNKTADEIFEPWQRQTYDDIGADVGRAEAARELGQGIGSQTAARMSDANALNANGTLSKILRAGAYLKGGLVGGQAADAAITATTKKINGKIGDRLGETIVDPNVAIDVLRNTDMTPGRLIKLSNKNFGAFSGLADGTYQQITNKFPYVQADQEQR